MVPNLLYSFDSLGEWSVVWVKLRRFVHQLTQQENVSRYPLSKITKEHALAKYGNIRHLYEVKRLFAHVQHKLAGINVGAHNKNVNKKSKNVEFSATSFGPKETLVACTLYNNYSSPNVTINPQGTITIIRTY